jgi:S-formylglutathione hydrolase FrmB
MGGYGAIKFGLKYPDKFAFAGSMSGALRAARYPTALMLIGWGTIKTSLKTAFGATNSETRRSNDIFEIARQLRPEQKSNLPYFYLDCGTEDFLIADNRDFAALLLEKKIPHEFRQLPGGHNWQYWSKQTAEILQILDRTFTPARPLGAQPLINWGEK